MTWKCTVCMIARFLQQHDAREDIFNSRVEIDVLHVAYEKWHKENAEERPLCRRFFTEAIRRYLGFKSNRHSYYYKYLIDLPEDVQEHLDRCSGLELTGKFKPWRTTSDADCEDVSDAHESDVEISEGPRPIPFEEVLKNHRLNKDKD